MEEDNTWRYYCDEWNGFRQLECRCDVSRPNEFTGNCKNCNLIIKPIKDKNVYKHTK